MLSEATHHELGPDGYAYYRADTTPHQKWGGLGWCDLGQYADVTTWATPIDQEPVVKSKSKYIIEWCKNHKFKME